MRLDKEGSVSFQSGAEETTSYRIKRRLWSSLWQLLAVGLLMTSVVRMIGSVFPGLTESSYKMRWIGMEMFICFGLYSWLFPWVEERLKKGKKLFRGVIFLVSICLVAAGVVKYYRSDPLHVEDGFLMFGEAIFRVVNIAFQTNFHVDRGNMEYVPMALGLSIFVMIFLGYLLDYLTRRHFYWMLLPFVVWSGELWIGTSPSYQSMALFLLGCFGFYVDYQENSRNLIRGVQTSKKEERHGIAFPTLVLAIFLLCLIVLVPVNNQFGVAFVLGNSQKVKSMQESIEKRLKEGLFQIPTVTNMEKKAGVDNRAPMYKGEEIFTVNAEKKPTGNLYMSNFIGSTYDKGSWGYDEKAFLKACKDADIEVSVMQKLLQTNIYGSALASEQGKGNISGNAYHTGYKITYQKAAGNSGYMSYFTDFSEESMENIQLLGDVLRKKSKDCKEIAYQGGLTNQLADRDVYVFLKDEYSTAEEKMWAFYDSFVREQYLTTCWEVPSVKEIVRSTSSFGLRQFEEEGQWQQNGGKNLWQENLRKVAAAFAVQQYLGGYEYSLELDKITDGSDSVEYMLTTGKKGYCEHFATAGVLLLREMGIPARYAAGFVVEESLFAKNEEGDYEAVVLDSKAHAWVEIYMDHMGWIPFEMTPGYVGSMGNLEGLEAYFDKEVNGNGLNNQGNVPGSIENNGDNPNASSDDLNDSKKDSPDGEKPGDSETESSEASEEPEGSEDGESGEADGNANGNNANDNGSGSNANGNNASGNNANGNNGLAGNGQSGNGNGVGTSGATEDGGSSVKTGLFLKKMLSFLKKAGPFLLVLAFLGLLAHYQYRQEQRERRVLEKLLRRQQYRRSIQKIHRKLYKRLRRRGKFPIRAPRDSEVLEVLIKTYPQVAKTDWELYFIYVREAAFSNEEMSQEKARFCHSLLKKVEKE